MGGEGAWCGGRGFVTDNPRQIKLSHTPRYTVEQCAADCKRCAGTAADLRILEFNMRYIIFALLVVQYEVATSV